MSDIDSKIRRRVDQFVADMTALIREAALESVSQALGAEAAPRQGKRRRSSGASRRAPKKRSAAELAATEARLLAHVKANPGLGIERIARALEASTKDLALPARRLLEAGKLTTRGQRRATKYYAGKAELSSGRAGIRRRKKKG